MGYDLKTRNGYNMYEMSSMLQKAIRRSDVRHAVYAAYELSLNFRNYMWKRIYTCSAEDCYGIITKEIVALKQADDFVNAGAKKGSTNDLFIAKAIILLCLARKNRDADYVACNFMWGDKLLTDEEFDKFVDKDLVNKYCTEGIDYIPDYVFDCHTWKGKANGKTKLDMIQTEQKALKPYQPSLFDEGDWSEFFNHVAPKFPDKVKEFQKGKVLDPTEKKEEQSEKPNEQFDIW